MLNYQRLFRKVRLQSGVHVLGGGGAWLLVVVVRELCSCFSSHTVIAMGGNYGNIRLCGLIFFHE